MFVSNHIKVLVSIRTHPLYDNTILHLIEDLMLFYWQLKGQLTFALILQWICCSTIAAASKRPMPLKILMRLDKARISLFLAFHKCRMASVGLGLVAKNVTYRCTFSLSAKSLQSCPSAVGGSSNFDNEDSMLALRRKRPASETKLLLPRPED